MSLDEDETSCSEEADKDGEEVISDDDNPDIRKCLDYMDTGSSRRG